MSCQHGDTDNMVGDTLDTKRSQPVNLLVVKTHIRYQAYNCESKTQICLYKTHQCRSFGQSWKVKSMTKVFKKFNITKSHSKYDEDHLLLMIVNRSNGLNDYVHSVLVHTLY